MKSTFEEMVDNTQIENINRHDSVIGSSRNNCKRVNEKDAYPMNISFISSMLSNSNRHPNVATNNILNGRHPTTANTDDLIGNC